MSTSTLLCLSIFMFSYSSAVKHGPCLREAKVQRRSTVKIVDDGLYFIFSFLFPFIFLFLEQLGLGFISHAVTSVTS